jgi:hypothetical protein
LRERKFIVQANPYASGTVLFKAWERGYAQDTRRIVSGMVCNGT